jgi:hypothetical protein
MSGIFGHLNVSDNDRVFASTVGQQVIYETAIEWINQQNADMLAAYSLFVERTTENFKMRYKLPGGGYLQQRGPDGRYAAVKATGQWDVAFPLRDYGAQVAGNDVDMRYMTIQDLDRHLMTVMAQNIATVRFELLKSLLNNTEKTFSDPLQGDLSVEPLANGDTVLYPPVIGSQTEATEDHYVGSNYTAANISTTNNPYVTIRDELEEHFGVASDGSNIVVMIHPDQLAKTVALGSGHWTGVQDQFIRPGDDTAILQALGATFPGVLRGRCDGVWVVEWRYIPSGYMFGLHLDVARPVIRRVDPADTGLGDGLQLVATDEAFPFQGSFWRHRFGYGVGNRLNGYALQLVGTTSYTIPTLYQ